MINSFFKYLLFTLVLISACGQHRGKISLDPKNLPIRVDGELDFVSSDGSVLASILIEIADTPKAQTKGLMGRDSMDLHHGMLFVFKTIKVQQFRMANTRMPLDIIMIEENGCIRDIFQNSAPMSKQIYRSSGPIKYAVEVQGNFTKRFKINKDTCIRWRHF